MSETPPEHGPPIVSEDQTTVTWNGHTYVRQDDAHDDQTEDHKPGKGGGVIGGLDKEDFQGILALLVLLGAFALQAVILFLDTTGDQVATIPSWVTGVVMAIVGFWYGQSSNSGDKK